MELHAFSIPIPPPISLSTWFLWVFPVHQAWALDVQNRLLDSVGEGEGGMFWENSMYIIYSETDHQPRWDEWDKFSFLKPTTTLQKRRLYF